MMELRRDVSVQQLGQGSGGGKEWDRTTNSDKNKIELIFSLPNTDLMRQVDGVVHQLTFPTEAIFDEISVPSKHLFPAIMPLSKIILGHSILIRRIDPKRRPIPKRPLQSLGFRSGQSISRSKFLLFEIDKYSLDSKLYGENEALTGDLSGQALHHTSGGRPRCSCSVLHGPLTACSSSWSCVARPSSVSQSFTPSISMSKSYKVVVIGSGGVGKSCFTIQLISGYPTSFHPFSKRPQHVCGDLRPNSRRHDGIHLPPTHPARFLPKAALN